jgi:hypothetical protein
MMRKLGGVLLVLALFGAWGCKKEAPVAPAPAPVVEEAPAPAPEPAPATAPAPVVKEEPKPVEPPPPSPAQRLATLEEGAKELAGEALAQRLVATSALAREAGAGEAAVGAGRLALHLAATVALERLAAASTEPGLALNAGLFEALAKEVSGSPIPAEELAPVRALLDILAEVAPKENQPKPPSLKELAAGKDLVADCARALLMVKALRALAVPTPGDEALRWKSLAAHLGTELCPACAELETTPVEELAKVLLSDPANGFVCPVAEQAPEAPATATPEAPAAAEPAAASPGLVKIDHLAAVRRDCPQLFGLTPEEAQLITVDRVLPMRVASYLATLDASANSGGTVARLLTDLGIQLRAKAPAALLLYRPWEPSMAGVDQPRDPWAKDRPEPATARFDYQPLPFLYLSDQALSLGMLAATQVQGANLGPLDRELGLTFPGRTLLSADEIKALLDQRRDKAGKLPRVKLPVGEALVETDDLVLPPVRDASAQLAKDELALEKTLFPAVEGKRNDQRPPVVEDRGLGGAFTLYLEPAAKALYARAALMSLNAAGFREIRLARADGPLGIQPTVHFDEFNLPAESLDLPYKRPLIVHVKAKSRISVYPPANAPDRAFVKPTRKPAPLNSPWPGKYRSIVDERIVDPAFNLFLAYTDRAKDGWLDETAALVGEMMKKWDAGNVIYVVADDDAPAGMVALVAARLAFLHPKGLPALEQAYPGVLCDEAGGGCPSTVVVLFPEVALPRLPGKVKLKEAELQVYCDKADIQAKIASKRGAFKFCYDPELQKNPALKGKVSYQFTIDLEGNISEISVAGDELGNAKVVDCATNVLKRIKFRKPVGGECKIRYPYNFTP